MKYFVYKEEIQATLVNLYQKIKNDNEVCQKDITCIKIILELEYELVFQEETFFI